MTFKTWLDAERQLLCVRFEGHLCAESGRQSAKQLAELLGTGTADLVFDVREMTGYATEARAAWQEMLGPKQDQLSSITLVGGNALVRMGGQVLGLLLGVKTRHVARWEEV